MYLSVTTADGQSADRLTRPPPLVAFLLILIGFTVVASGFFAIRNFRAERGDRQGAWIVALVSPVSMMGGWVFGTTHVAHSWELALIFGGIGRAAVTGQDDRGHLSVLVIVVILRVMTKRRLWSPTYWRARCSR